MLLKIQNCLPVINVCVLMVNVDICIVVKNPIFLSLRYFVVIETMSF